MIARIWRGWTSAEGADAYVGYPEDDPHLVDRELTVEHYELFGAENGLRAFDA